ncbi:MAG TPA: type II secretion system F family protein [Bordetella sp.]
MSVLAIMLSGLCAAGLVYLLLAPLRPGLQPVPAVSSMPWWWRCAWPWTRALTPLAEPLMSWRTREKKRQALGRAGVPPQIGPQHWLAMTWLMACAGGGAALGLALVLAWPPAIPVALAALAGAGWPGLWLRSQAMRRKRRIDRDMPFVLDMMTLCVEAGLGLHGALQQSVQCSAPGPLRDTLDGALADMRTGMSRMAALKAMAGRSGSASLQAWAASMAQADALGMSLGPLMRGQAAQCRADRFQHAERLAMEAPVKMLLPLIGCIFPCTFIVLGFPIAWQLLPALQ